MPQHETLVMVLVVTTNALNGCVIVVEFVDEQPFVSVMVAVYVPAIKPVLSSVVIPPPQLKVYVPVPPVGVMFIAPVLLPKHATFVLVFVLETAVAGCVIVVKFVVEQPFTSVIVAT